jgi:hypothetical protein
LYYPLDAGIRDEIREQDLPELKNAILAQNGSAMTTSGGPKWQMGESGTP